MNNLMKHTVMKSLSKFDLGAKMQPLVKVYVKLTKHVMCSQMLSQFEHLTLLHRGIKERKGHILFNNTLNTFWDHSDSARGNLLLPHGLLFPISSKGSFICTIPDRITNTTAFVTPVVEHWLE